MTIFPHKVRHVLPSRDVWICLAANYLHIDIFEQKLQESLNFLCLVTLHAMFL